MYKGKVDIIIPIAMNDLDSLRMSLPFIKKYLPWKRIIIIAKKEMQNYLSELSDSIKFYDEDKLLNGLTFDNVKSIIFNIYPKAVRRTGWYFQQFLKLAYAYSCNDEYYLTWDSDTLPLKEITFWDNEGKPFLDYVPMPYGDNDYFKLLTKLPPTFAHQNEKLSFITEHMLFHSATVKNMINEIENSIALDGDTFYKKTIRSIDKDKLNLSGFSEFETYAAYVQNTSDRYVLRLWKNLRNGKFYIGRNPSSKQLKWVSESFDVASIEDYDCYCLLNKWLSESDSFRKQFIFKEYYSIVNPMYKIYSNTRLWLRSIIRS
ncbi:DUF6492 family protein [Segatella buccae]|jgi:hypothetical protein